MTTTFKWNIPVESWSLLSNALKSNYRFGSQNVGEIKFSFVHREKKLFSTLDSALNCCFDEIFSSNKLLWANVCCMIEIHLNHVLIVKQFNSFALKLKNIYLIALFFMRCLSINGCHSSFWHFYPFSV